MEVMEVIFMSNNILRVPSAYEPVYIHPGTSIFSCSSTRLVETLGYFSNYNTKEYYFFSIAEIKTS